MKRQATFVRRELDLQGATNSSLKATGARAIYGTVSVGSMSSEACGAVHMLFTEVERAREPGFVPCGALVPSRFITPTLHAFALVGRQGPL